MISWPASYYTSTAHFDEENALIFERSWICVGRSSILSKSGDFTLVNVGCENLLLVRKDDNALRAFVNLCRHRGARLCTEGQGAFRRGTRCPYHGWTYDFDGKLIGAPFIKDLPAETKDRHLFQAATTEWLGYIWVNLDREAAPLADQVEPMLRHRFGDEDVPAYYGCDNLDVAKRNEYEIAANWKILFENFCECYHCPTMHPEICKILPSWTTGYGTVSGPNGPQRAGSPLASGASGFSLSGKAAAATLPGVPLKYARTFHGILLWPNVHLMFLPDHVMCMRLMPQAPDRTRVVTEWLFHPDAIKEADFDPADAAALVDITAREDFEACERVQDGVRSAYFEEFHTPHESLIEDFRTWVKTKLMPHDAGIVGQPECHHNSSDIEAVTRNA